MRVTLPDGKQLELENGALGLDAAQAIGRGLAFPLGDITFSLEKGGVKGSIPGWRFYQSRVYQSYIISVCAADEKAVFAFTTGKLKVEGSLEKALMLQKFV